MGLALVAQVTGHRGGQWAERVRMDEEKAMELEALMAIYMDDFQMVDEDHFIISLVPNPGSEDDIVGVEMEVKYTAGYPQEAPILHLKSKKGVTKSQCVELEEKIKTQAADSLGTAMIFTLAQTVKDWLDEHNREPADDIEDDIVDEKEDEATEVGTPITVETFLAWKAAFDMEMAELNKNKIDLERLRRPTGRQLFEIDASLILSDASILEDGDQVAVFSPIAARAAQLPAVNWDLFVDEELDEN